MNLKRWAFVFSIILNLPLVFALGSWALIHFIQWDVVELPLVYILLFMKNLPALSAGYVLLSFLSGVVSWKKDFSVTDKTVCGINIFASGLFAAYFAARFLNR